MSGSKSKNDLETETNLPSTVDRVSLVGFLAPPPRSRSSAAPPAHTETEAGASPDTSPDSTRSEAADQLEEPPAIAPSSSNAGARSLIPVETSGALASDDEGLDLVPAPVFSMANVRRVAIAAALVAGIGGSAWLVRRAPAMSARDSASSVEKTAAAAPQSAPPRTIEADENADLLTTTTEITESAATLDPVKGLELRRQARQLLETGQIDQGVALARRAIEANPADPECYVLLAAGLQDQGRWQESREVFSRCINRSKSGINSECVYFATTGTTASR